MNSNVNKHLKNNGQQNSIQCNREFHALQPRAFFNHNEDTYWIHLYTITNTNKKEQISFCPNFTEEESNL